MEIVKLKEEHFEGIRAIYEVAIKEGKSTFQSVTPTYEEWDKAYTEEGRFVALQDNKVVGFTALGKVSNRCVYNGVGEVCVYVHDEYKRKGIGKILLNYLVKYSEEAGFWTLNSNIFEENEGSIKLHESCGFRVVGVKERLGKDIKGRWLNIVLMERRSKLF